MADKNIEPVSGNHLSPYMQDVTGLFVASAGKADRVLRVSSVAELVPLVEQCHVDASPVLSVRHAMAIVLPAERGGVQEADKHGIVFYFAKSDQSGGAPFAGSGDDFCQLLQFVIKPSGCPMAVAGGKEVVVGGKRVVFRVEEVFDVIAHHAKVCLSG